MVEHGGVVPVRLPPSERDVLVHGTAAQAEFADPAPPSEIRYRGWGAVVAAENQHAWIHLPIPVTVDVPGVGPLGGESPFGKLRRLVRVEVHYELDGGVVVRDLHLWDGGSRFFAWDYPDPHPSSLAVGSAELVWHGAHDVGAGLGLSIGVTFPTAIDSQEPPTTLTLYSATAHVE